MKRILLVTRPMAPPWDEASKNFAYELACGISTFKFTVLTPGKIKNLDKQLTQLHIYSSKHLTTYQKLRLIKLYLHRNEFDIVHIMLTPNKLNSSSAKRIFGNGRSKIIQTVATVRDDIYSESEIRKIMFGDIIVTYSDFSRNKLLKLGMNNVVKVYPGIDLSNYQPSSKDKNMMQEYDIKLSDFVVTYPGEYSRLGVTDELIEIIPNLVKKIPSIKFVFACRIKSPEDIRKKAEIGRYFSSIGLADHVVYTDTVNDMAKLYNISDLILFPVKDMSAKIDVPLSIIEAMACEKPVVVSDLPMLSEFTSKSNSAIVPANNILSLKELIYDLYKDSSRRETIGKNARNYVQENFDVANSRKKYEKIYSGLTGI